MRPRAENSTSILVPKNDHGSLHGNLARANVCFLLILNLYFSHLVFRCTYLGGSIGPTSPRPDVTDGQHDEPKSLEEVSFKK